MSFRTVWKCDECGDDLDELEPLSCPEHRARISIREPLGDRAVLAFDSDLCGPCKRKLFRLMRENYPVSWKKWETIREIGEGAPQYGL